LGTLNGRGDKGLGEDPLQAGAFPGMFRRNKRPVKKSAEIVAEKEI